VGAAWDFYATLGEKSCPSLANARSLPRRNSVPPKRITDSRALLKTEPPLPFSPRKYSSVMARQPFVPIETKG
jgi:hypothetical protein